MSSFTDLPALNPAGRPHKPRSKASVKPILKKAPHSEKNSLDLDRGWEDAIHYGNHGWGGAKKSLDSFAGRASTSAAPPPGLGLYEGPRGKDVSFSLSAADVPGAGPSYAPRKYSHARSASGTSHVSVATSASGARGAGGFVHPFQQTPRGATPPLSYANSLAEPETPRDYSPTITEGGDDADVALRGFHTTPQHGLRRPSLASQRTSSATELGLRVNTARANTAPSMRLQGSRSELRLELDSPQSATAPAQTHLSPCPGSGSHPGSTAASLSPLRSSLEMNFRMRSRSEVDTAARQAQIREARRQFEDKEAVKQAMRDEKAARRRDAEASRVARRARREERPEVGRRDTAETEAGEKVSWGVGAEGGEDEEEEGVRRVSARRRTASVWTSFILWVRTKLLKAGRR